MDDAAIRPRDAFAQPRIGYFWSLERVNIRLAKMMMEAFNAVYATSKQYNVTLRNAAYIVGIDKVARTLKIRGIYA